MLVNNKVEGRRPGGLDSSQRVVEGTELMRYVPKRTTSIVLALAIVLVGITAAPVTAQEQTDPGECDYASGDEGDYTAQQDNGNADSDALRHCRDGGEHEQPPREIIVSEGN